MKEVLKKNKTNKSKISPHKIKKPKNLKINHIDLNNTLSLLKRSIYFKLVQYSFDLNYSKYTKVSLSDLGYLFSTPGVWSPQITINTSYSSFFKKKKILGYLTNNYTSGDIVSNVRSNVNGGWCYSQGSFGVVNGNGAKLKLILPSSYSFPLNKTYLYIGSNISVIGYSSKRLKKTILSVRGVAKNPIDHPNGGRSNTKGSFKTPWGFIAKNNK